MKRYIQLILPFFFINPTIADVPMVMIVDGSQRDAEEVIAVAASSIGNIDDPEQAHKEIFQQEGGKEKAEKYFEYLGDLVRKKKPETRCLVPDFNGAIFSDKWKEALWDKFYTAAPQRHRQCVEQYKIVKRA